jgi:hypothetical protein
MHDCAHLFARATIYFARIVKVMPIFALPERRWHGMSLTGPRPPGVKSPEHAVVRAGLGTTRLALSFDADPFPEMKETAHTARLSHCPRPRGYRAIGPANRVINSMPQFMESHK